MPYDIKYKKLFFLNVETLFYLKNKLSMLY